MDFPNNKSSHNYYIDFLRFIASMSVVFFHYNLSNLKHGLYDKITNYGWLGVPVFFVISGYCIMLSVGNNFNGKTFAYRRIFRVFPAYWFSIIIVLMSALFQKIYTGTNSIPIKPDSILDIPATLLLLTRPLNNIKTINWVYWSLTCELFFYLVIGITLFINKHWLKTSLILFSLLAALLPEQKQGILFFLDHWPAFSIGASIYYFSKREYKSFYFCAFIFFNIFSLFKKHLVINPEYIIACLFAVLVMLLSLNKTFSIKSIMLMRLGNYSYSVYLLHVPIAVFFSPFRNPSIQNNIIWLIIYDLLTYFAVSILAWQVYKRIEVPFINLGRKLAAKTN